MVGMRELRTEFQNIEKLDRDKVYALESLMKLSDQVELKVVHHFSHGVYARELHIPAGVMLTGEIHKLENLNILSQGRIRVLTEDGLKDVEAPFTIVSPPGTKRIAYAITNCIWTTIHGTYETDVETIRHQFIAATEQEYLDYCGHAQLTLPFEVH